MLRVLGSLANDAWHVVPIEHVVYNEFPAKIDLKPVEKRADELFQLFSKIRKTQKSRIAQVSTKRSPRRLHVQRGKRLPTPSIVRAGF